ncbi:ArsA family ATPase [Fusibacter bizertensis]|uniref:ArsA family ATPase n=1 Tax=Fusibacter bizertensis TaxID=1488331 RepID=A0ABT6NG75_9FIRM|nr:ArsA family ATPase [Fusibacter bizertensis]MDH8679377.1 ArsA family ATPase [Fusibacter bizertensis]
MLKVEFYGGKGGVGKTTLSSARAHYYTKLGKKTLLVSTDPAHSISDVLGIQVGSKLKSITPLLDAIEIDPEEEANLYIDQIRRDLNSILSPVVLEDVNKQLRAARVMPGTHEASLFDKMIELMDLHKDVYDVMIFDTAPTGHTLRLLTLPELLIEWFEGLIKKREKIVKLKAMLGLKEDDPILARLKIRRDTFLKAKDMIRSDNTSIHLVMNPEKMPLEETKKAMKYLNDAHQPVAEIIINKILPPDIVEPFFKNKIKKEQEVIAEVKAIYSYLKITEIYLLDQDMDADSLFKIVELL